MLKRALLIVFCLFFIASVSIYAYSRGHSEITVAEFKALKKIEVEKDKKSDIAREKGAQTKVITRKSVDTIRWKQFRGTFLKTKH